MKIVIPLDITIKFKPSKNKTKDTNRTKEVVRWLVNDLKNLYIPIGDDDTVTIKSIKVGKIK